MPGASDEEMLAALKDSVEMLAAPAETQVAWLHAKGFPVDELALQLDDEVPGWLALLRRAGLLTEHAQNAITALHDELGVFSGPPDSPNAAHWTENALHQSEQWQRVRQLAKDALTEMSQ